MKKIIFTILFLIMVICMNNIHGECKTQPAINKSSFNLLKGKTFQLYVKNSTDWNDIIWTTKDKLIATVNKNGLVTGVGVGETTILCSVKIGDKYYDLSSKVKILEKPNKVDDITIKTKNERIVDTNKERMVINAYNGNTLLWTYTTKYRELAMLDSFSKVYKKNDMLYFRDWKFIVTLDAKTGKLIWKVKGCGSGDLLFDNEGYIYAIGFLGPDIFCADVNGNVQYTKSYDKELYWAYDLKIKNNVLYLTYDHEATPEIKVPYHKVSNKWGYENVCIKIDKKTGNVIK